MTDLIVNFYFSSIELRNKASEEVSYLGNSRNKIALEKDEDEKGDLDSNDQDLCYLVPLKPEDYANLREPIKTKSLLVDPELIDPVIEVK